MRFLLITFALLALVLNVMAGQGPNVKSPKNNKPTSSAKAEVGSEWIDEDPKMQLAGDAGPAEFSRAKVFLEATTASGSPSAPNEAPKETGHVPAPGKYTHVTSGGAKLGAIPLPDTFERLWHPPAPAPAPAAPPAPAPAPASKKGKAVAGAAAPKAPKAPKVAPPAKAPKKKEEKKAEPAVVVVPAPKKGAKGPAPSPAVAVAAPAPAPIDSSVVSVASAAEFAAEDEEERRPRGLHLQVDDDGNVLRCHTGLNGEERCH